MKYKVKWIYEDPNDRKFKTSTAIFENIHAIETVAREDDAYFRLSATTLEQFEIPLANVIWVKNMAYGGR